MCNHYEQSAGATELAIQRAAAKLSAQVAAEMNGWREQTFPAYPAAIIRQSGRIREAVVMSWGISAVVQGKSRNITNARSDKFLSGFWRRLAKTRRCLIPATAYYEPGLGPVGAKGEVRFAPRDRS
jgi:putative SOS response-associated peptidase YedK